MKKISMIIGLLVALCGKSIAQYVNPGGVNPTGGVNPNYAHSPNYYQNYYQAPNMANMPIQAPIDTFPDNVPVNNDNNNNTMTPFNNAQDITPYDVASPYFTPPNAERPANDIPPDK